MSEGAHWELYNLLRDQEIVKVKQMASLMMVEMLGKVWLEQLMRGQCLSLRIDSQNMEETRAGRGCRLCLRPVCVSLWLPAGPSYLLVLVLSTWNMAAALLILFSHPSASRQELLEPLLLSDPITREGHATSARTCYPPSFVLPGLWRSRIPGRGTQKEILVLKNTEQNCFRSLFLKQTCLLWWSVSVLTA